MKREEVQRRILDLLTEPSERGAMVDSQIARELNIDVKIVQGNLLLLNEAGFVDLAPAQWIGPKRQPLVATLSPKGYVLLHDPEGSDVDDLPRARALLNVMKRQVATLGFAYAPPYLVLQMEEQQRLVAELEQRQTSHTEQPPVA